MAGFNGSPTKTGRNIYDGFDKLQDFYHDIIVRAKEQNLLQIRILGSNTFSQKLEKHRLGELISVFKKELDSNSILTDILVAQGNLTREWLTNLKAFGAFANLPAAGGATNVILVGETVFMVSFREFPVGLKIDHPDIARTMHFLFDVAGKYIKVKNQFSDDKAAESVQKVAITRRKQNFGRNVHKST